jgi:hypothetical protein
MFVQVSSFNWYKTIQHYIIGKRCEFFPKLAGI